MQTVAQATDGKMLEVTLVHHLDEGIFYGVFIIAIISNIGAAGPW